MPEIWEEGGVVGVNQPEAIRDGCWVLFIGIEGMYARAAKGKSMARENSLKGSYMFREILNDMYVYFDFRTLIAMLALFVACWSIYSARKHNRLSVRPFLCDSITSDSSSYFCSINIVNKGLGPALVKERLYYIDGNPVSFQRVIDMFAVKPSEFNFRVRDIRPGSVISKDENVAVLEIEWDRLKYSVPESVEIRSRIAHDIKEYAMEISKRMSVTILYESMYGEPYSLKSLTASDKKAE